MSTATKTFEFQVRDYESPMENAERVATDAIYFARDSGQNMHEAGALAGRKAVEAYLAAQPETRS